jgi:hypothetical protein
MSQAVAKLQRVKTWSGKNTDRFQLNIGIAAADDNRIVQVLRVRSVLNDAEIARAIQQAIADCRLQNIVRVASPADKAFAKAQ